MTPRFVECTGVEFNTIPPNDFGHYEMLNELVQAESADALDAELAGQFAAIGIVKDEEFAPDPRMRAILETAVAFGNAASRTLGTGAHPRNAFRYYDSTSAWWNMLFEGGYEFQSPPPKILADGSVEQSENKGARHLHARTAMFYTSTGITPAMCMYLVGVGSQYLIANVDSEGRPLDGGKNYKMELPAGIPAERFWSTTVYDNQSRSMLQTPQRYPRAGSQSYPTPAAVENADGSTTVYFGPNCPPVSRSATGCKPSPVRAGSRSSASTSRSSRSSTRPGEPAKSKRSRRHFIRSRVEPEGLLQTLFQ